MCFSVLLTGFGVLRVKHVCPWSCVFFLFCVKSLYLHPCGVHVCPVSPPPPAVLHGLDLESEHCMFENQNGKVTLVPLGGAQCSVNGVQVTEPSQLNQGETHSDVPTGLLKGQFVICVVVWSFSQSFYLAGQEFLVCCCIDKESHTTTTQTHRSRQLLLCSVRIFQNFFI